MKASSDGRPRYLAVAPVAMISASQVYSPLSPTRRMGFPRGGWCGCGRRSISVLKRSACAETRHQVRALHAVRVGRPVVHVGGGHQLAALGQAGDQHGLQVGAGGVDGGAVAGRAGTENQRFCVFCGHDAFL
jgi:hypothetical protein